MTEQIGLWRATYTPGDWIALGGPTSLVILKPAAAYLSTLVEQLWRVVVEADSLDALVAELAKHNVSQMPDFAAFFWHGGSMRSLIRGEVEITDLDSGGTIAGGAEVQTWNEVGLGDVRRVRVELGGQGSTPGSGVRLPLVVGAASAGSVELDATAEALVRSPQGVPAAEILISSTAVPIPVPGQPPIAEIESDRSAVVEAEVVEDRELGPAADNPVPIELGRSRGTEPEDQPQSQAELHADAFDTFAQEEEVFQLFGQQEQSASPFSPFDQPEPSDQPPSSEHDQRPRSVDPHNPFAVPVVQDREDGRPREPFASQRPGAGLGAPPPLGAAGAVGAGPAAFGAPGLPPLAGPQGPGAPDSAYAQGAPRPRAAGFGAPPEQPAPQEGMVLGVTCAMGHPNPPDAQRCRRCGGPLQGQPRLMPQPVMVVLRPNSGQPVEVDRSVLIGRSPQASKASGEESPRLMTVVSPSTDISRTHLQVSPAGWETVATDLHSTNGTLLIRPGQPEPERLAPGEAVRIFPGCVLDLGDGVSIHVDHPS